MARPLASALALAAAVASALAACGPGGGEPVTCEELDQAIVDRYAACGIMATPAPPQEDWTEAEECLLRCNWPCNRDAPCGALDGTDADAAAERFDCLVGCNQLCL